VLTYLKWSFWIVFWTLILGVLHYTLPRWDTVRIVDTYQRLETFGANSLFWSDARTGSGEGQISRDIFFIQTVKPNGDSMVYRNEDTGWGWPPFFKFDTTNLQTQAADLRSTVDDPTWTAIMHYGWRIELLSIYPNALAVKEVESGETYVFPWISAIILLILGALFWAIYARWRRFWSNRGDPLLDDDI